MKKRRKKRGTWHYREEKTPPHHCGYCKTKIDHYLVLVVNGKDADWPRCPHCQGC